MPDLNLRIGQHVKLVVEGAAPGTEFEGTILLAGKKDLMLSFPRLRDLPGAHPGARALLSLWDDFGLHQGKSRIVTVTSQPSPALIIERPGDFVTKQKRGYFRLATSLALQAVPPGTFDPWRSITDDISAGGVKFKTSHAANLGDRLQLTIDFPRPGEALTYEGVVLDSKVVRTGNFQIDDELQFIICCQFQNVREVERDRLVKLLLDLQSRAR